MSRAREQGSKWWDEKWYRPVGMLATFAMTRLRYMSVHMNMIGCTEVNKSHNLLFRIPACATVSTTRPGQLALWVLLVLDISNNALMTSATTNESEMSTVGNCDFLSQLCCSARNYHYVGP